MTPSKYQEAIFAALSESWDSLLIEAVAGSGKTTTIVEGLKKIPSTKKCLFLAFNKAIADSLNEKVPSYVEARTFHSLGWAACKDNIGWFKTNDNKTRNIFYYKVNDLKKLSDFEKKELFQQTPAMCQMVSLLKANMVTTEEEFEDNWLSIAEKNDVRLPKDPRRFKSSLRRVYWMSVETTVVVDYDDMIFLPVVKGSWKIPVKYDCIFVDEAQDLSPVQHAFLALFLAPAGRIVAVGDSAQAIYGFRGASPYSMEEMKAYFKMKPLPLSICYRCGSEIVKEAQQYISHIEPAADSIPGIVRESTEYEMVRTASAGDMILCRNVSPLLSLLPQLLSAGKRVKFPYPDIQEELAQVLEACKQKEGSTVGLSLLEFLRKGTPAVEHGEELLPLLRYFGTHYPSTIIYKKHFEEFLNESDNSIFVASVHKAKGLESDRVFYYLPELAPTVSLDWQLVQERNLRYVATTRARKELVYVRG